MENIYVNNNNTCELIKAQKGTIEFLMNYSLSLDIIEVHGMKFENNLN